MHKLIQLIKNVNKTHKRLGPLVAVNILAAKAKMCVLNVAPAGCGKSSACDITHSLMKDNALKYTSITLAGLVKQIDALSNFTGHVIIDDLGAEKSLWSRVSTITTLATLVHTHNVHKVTQAFDMQISNFDGSAALNIQPVLLNSLVQSDDWIAVIRDKVLRYYHLIRPIEPNPNIPALKLEWSVPLSKVEPIKHKGKLWYQLVAIGLTQWSYARCNEHIPKLVRAAAALDGRTQITKEDYNLIIKLLRPMQLERYMVTSYGFEEGRNFQNNVYCILVEIVSHGTPSIEMVCEDYKINPSTAERVIATSPDWCWLKSNSPKKLMPTDEATRILNLIGVYQKW